MLNIYNQDLNELKNKIGYKIKVSKYYIDMFKEYQYYLIQRRKLISELKKKRNIMHYINETYKKDDDKKLKDYNKQLVSLNKQLDAINNKCEKIHHKINKIDTQLLLLNKYEHLYEKIYFKKSSLIIKYNPDLQDKLNFINNKIIENIKIIEKIYNILILTDLINFYISYQKNKNIKYQLIGFPSLTLLSYISDNNFTKEKALIKILINDYKEILKEVNNKFNDENLIIDKFLGSNVKLIADKLKKHLQKLEDMVTNLRYERETLVSEVNKRKF